MRHLFAPWRMDYISQSERGDACVFCEMAGRGVSEETLVLWQGPLAFVVLNRYPYVSGHMMVVPNRHVGALKDLSAEEWDGTLGLVRTVVAALEEVYRPHGFNVGMNLGRAAGAGIEDHLHVHVVPRWNGDNNFVPVLSETRVIPEALGVTWKRLRPAFERLEEEVPR